MTDWGLMLGHYHTRTLPCIIIMHISFTLPLSMPARGWGVLGRARTYSHTSGAKVAPVGTAFDAVLKHEKTQKVWVH